MSCHSSPNCLLPVVNNSDSIHVNQTTKSTSSSRTNNLDDAQYESFILYNLAKNIDPCDISINAQSIVRDLSINNTNIDICLNAVSNLKDHVLINNDDRFIQSELFAMNIKTRNTIGGAFQNYKQDLAIIGPYGNIIDSDIYLNNNTKSYYDSNLKVEVTLNNDDQNSDISGWRVQFDRKYNNMNYFAAINSHLNVTGGSYPFKISENTTANINSLGKNGVYFTRGNDNQIVSNSLDVDVTPGRCGLSIIDNPGYVYTGDEFKCYKIQQLSGQSSASLALTLQNANESNAPIFYNTGEGFPVGMYNGENIYDDKITFSDISKNLNKFNSSYSSLIQNNFTATLDISSSSGTGYSIPGFSDSDRAIFTINDNELTTDGTATNLNYFNNNKPRGIHKLDISNGIVSVDSINANKQYVELTNDAETLPTDFADKPGVIKIKASSKNDRVSYPSGARTGMTHSINVIYTSAEIDNNEGFTDIIENELRVAGDVSYNCKLIVESTKGNDDSVTYNNADDSRNLERNVLVDNDTRLNANLRNARLVIANPNKPINFNIKNRTSFKIHEEDSLKLIRNRENVINILNIQQSKILVNDGGLFKDLSLNGEILQSSIVRDVSCNVTLRDTNLSNMKYTDYRVKAVTKTIEDLSNSIPTTNNWKFVYNLLENDSLGLSSDFSSCIVAGTDRTSELISNVNSFLKNNNNITIDYKLKFSNVSELVSFNSTTTNITFDSIANISHFFDTNSDDPTNVSSIKRKHFGPNDTKYANIITNDILLDPDVDNVVANDPSVFNSSDYIFERWLRQRSFKAQIDANFPSYKNVLLETPTLYEETVYYKAWKRLNDRKGSELYAGTLAFFTHQSKNMNTVTCRFVNKFLAPNGYNVDGDPINSQDPSLRQSQVIPSTRITIKPSDCKIFTANLQGKDLSNNTWNDLGYDSSNNVWITQRAHIDPYITQEGYITDYDPSHNVLSSDFNCLVNIRFPQKTNVNNPRYYIDITQPFDINSVILPSGDSLNLSSFDIKATLYSYSLNDISNNNQLLDYFSSNGYSPYNNDFTGMLPYKSPTTYICDLTVDNADASKYVLTVKHTNGESKKDVVITYPKDYVLNFNVIHAENDLFSIIRSKDSVVRKTITNTTQEGDPDKKLLKVDPGVYLKLVNNITFGMNEVFSLNRDKVHVKMIDDLTYKYNNPVWGDLSGTLISGVAGFDDVYKPIVFNHSNLGSGAPFNRLKIDSLYDISGAYKTRSIILKAVRGYNIGTIATGNAAGNINDNVNSDTTLANRNIQINRTPATYTFTLDVSFANPKVSLDELYDGSAVYLDMCNNIPSTTFPRPINRYDVSWNTANNWSQGQDLCYNNLNLTPRNRYVKSVLSIYRFQFDDPHDNIANDGTGVDFGLDGVTTIDTKIYTFARSGAANGTPTINGNNPFSDTNRPEDGQSGSEYTPADRLLQLSDGSYNYTYEKMTYKQTHSGGNGDFNITNLKSDDLPTGQIANSKWYSNTVTVTGTGVNAKNNVILDIGLKFNIHQSILPSSIDKKEYQLNVVPSTYVCSFKNPSNSINVTRNGTLYEGILLNFLNLKTRSIKAQFTTKIELKWSNQKIKVYSNTKDNVNINELFIGDPSGSTMNNNWEEIGTSPFFIDIGEEFTLHPSNLNAPYGFSMKKDLNIANDWTCYLVVAPPSICVEYNSLKFPTPILPFNQSNVTNQQKGKLYIDIKKSGITYNLYSLVGDSTKISNNLIIKPPDDFNLYKLKNNPSTSVKNIIINGNYITLSLRNGLEGRVNNETDKYDGSLNLTSSTDPSGSTYKYTTYNDISNNLIERIFPIKGVSYNRSPINHLINPIPNATYRAALITGSVKYDVSYNQDLTEYKVNNDTLNINFTIDNAFIPPITAYLTLGTDKSTSVTFYDNRLNYRDGKYYVVLNKYMLGDGTNSDTEYAGVDYNTLLKSNSNIREVTFKINARQQKAVELYMYDSSNNRPVQSQLNLLNATNVSQLLNNLTASNIKDAQWRNLESSGLAAVGLSFAALDQTGKNTLYKLLTFDPSEQISNKTLFIERNDILRVNSILGQPVFRITNDGNLITNKVSTAMLSLLQKSVRLDNRGFNGADNVGVENSNATGLFSLNTLDFSGNWLDGSGNLRG